MFWWRNLSDWNFAWFLFIAAYAMVFFVWSYMLYPPEVHEGLDFEQFFFANRQPFFGLLLIGSLLDIPEMVVKGRLGLRPVPGQYPVAVGVMMLIANRWIVFGESPITRWIFPQKYAGSPVGTPLTV